MGGGATKQGKHLWVKMGAKQPAEERGFSSQSQMNTPPPLSFFPPPSLPPSALQGRCRSRTARKPTKGSTSAWPPTPRACATPPRPTFTCEVGRDGTTNTPQHTHTHTHMQKTATQKNTAVKVILAQMEFCYFSPPSSPSPPIHVAF